MCCGSLVLVIVGEIVVLTAYQTVEIDRDTKSFGCGFAMVLTLIVGIFCRQSIKCSSSIVSLWLWLAIDMSL